MTNKKLNTNGFDACTSFHIDNGAFLGRFVRLDETLGEILTKHKYPEQVNAVIAECSALAVILSSSMKYDGLFTLQIQGNGPIPVVVVDVTSDGKIRACAKFDEDRINRAKEIRKTTDEIEATPHFLGVGHLAFTIDQGKDHQLYQGIVELKGKNMAEIALKYFRESEQIETYIKLFMNKSEKTLWKSAGIMLQRMPLSKEDDAEEVTNAWHEALVFAETLKENEVLDETISSENIINRLYHANNPVVSGAKSYKFACRCTRDKLLDTLRGFDKKDIDEMADKGRIDVTCNFCSEQYCFDQSELMKH